LLTNTVLSHVVCSAKLSGLLKKGACLGHGGFADVYEGFWQKELGEVPVRVSPIIPSVLNTYIAVSYKVAIKYLRAIGISRREEGYVELKLNKVRHAF